ncbi:MAG TPA: polysaccharide biosynthesis/export family protein [Candidatus Eisenbacteria bacterium]|nr:polysaccharide biosynthesis/export family protein [Candidatus Eisenbacteria bacterium]
MTRQDAFNFFSNSPARLSLVLALGLPMIVACSSSVTVPPLMPEEVPHFEAAANFPHQTYRFEPGDTIQIKYTFHPEMNQEVTVLPDGKILAQMVGEINVWGMTATQLERLLVQRTSDRLREPEVIVTVSRFAERHIYIGGEVQRPGAIPYRRGLSPLQAIIAAGGFLTSAQQDSVILVRAAGPDEKFITRKLNLSEAVKDGVKEPLYLAPHDILYVSKSPIAEADLWVKQHITDLLPFLFPSANTATGIIRTMRP